jgi:hypothetical protein
MSTYKKFKTDTKSECDGVILDFGEGEQYRIARAGGSNKAYLRAIEKTNRKYRRQIQLGILKEETSAKILRAIFSDTIVLGWEGVTGPSGEPLEFTRENAIKLFEDLPDLFDNIREAAADAALFRETITETDSGN